MKVKMQIKIELTCSLSLKDHNEGLNKTMCQYPQNTEDSDKIIQYILNIFKRIIGHSSSYVNINSATAIGYTTEHYQK